MRHMISAAALAVVTLALPAVTGPATAEPSPLYTGSMFDTTFDLGIDVSGVPHNPAAARSFLLTLRPDWQSKILAACGHFLADPYGITSPETYAFCSNALG